MNVELTRDELVTLAVVLTSPFTVADQLYWDRDSDRRYDLGKALYDIGKKIIPLIVGEGK